MECLFKEYEFLGYKFPQPQYLGAKYRLRSWIGSFLPQNIRTVVDPFAGSQSIAYYFKQLGYRVFTNDFMAYSDVIGKALVENNSELLDKSDIELILSDNPDEHEFDLMRRIFTGIFFKEEEATFIDAARGNIARLKTPMKRAMALAVMNRALTRKVTMGHFAHTQVLAYAADEERVKRNRSLIRPIRDLFLELVKEYNAAVFDNGTACVSKRGDAIDFVSGMQEADLVYFDPPYGSSHADYQQFYHLLETYTMYWKDKAFVNGVKRYDPKRETAFDQKKTIVGALEKLFAYADKIPHWLVSYNDRSYPDVDTLCALVGKYRQVRVEYKTYNESYGGKGSVAGSSEVLIIGEPK